MTHEARPRFGKDHLNLADWPISIATYQQPRTKDGGKVDYVEYVIRRADGNAQSVSIEASSKTGLPTPTDEDVIIALLALAKEEGFASDIVRFIPGRLLQIMGWPDNQKSYLRIANALKRLRAVTITYRLTWYSKTASVEPILITGILAEAKLVLRRGRRAACAIPDSYVQWTQNFLTSLKDGNLNDLDLDLYFSWKRPVAKHLHRHLNKVWYAGRRPKVYERDLRDLACGHLGMTASKDLKRNFQEVVKELEERQYLLPMDQTLRYRKVRRGVWRVRLDLHPSQLFRKANGEGESAKPARIAAPADDATVLVGNYHRVRFGREQYDAKRHELNHAKTLLKTYELPQVQKVLPTVATAVQRQFQGADCYFGAAVPYFEQALRDWVARDRSRSREATMEVEQSLSAAADSTLRHHHQQARTALLARWQQLPLNDRARCYDRAVAQADSAALCARLRRHRDLDLPPTEVLTFMAGEKAKGE